MLFDRDYKYILTCDLETNGINPNDQWLVGSFGLLDFKTLELIKEIEIESRPDVWLADAYEIHFIREETAMGFQSRKKALEQLIDFVPENKDDFIFLCHANTNNFGSFYHYDFAVLRSDFNLTLGYDSFEKCFDLKNVTSTHTMTRKLQKIGLVPKDVKRGLKYLCKYYGINLIHHNAKSDRIAMEQLLRIFNETRSKQVSLF